MNEYLLYDPLSKSNPSIPASEGIFLIVLRPNARFIESKEIATNPILAPIKYIDKTLDVLYVGTTRNLQEEYENHFLGTIGNNSSFWKSIGCLMGYTLYQGDIFSSKGAFSKFSVSAEKGIEKWISENLLFLYSANKQPQTTEQELINTYNPPLNILHNSNKTNLKFRKKLSELRNQSVSSGKTSRQSHYNNKPKATSINTEFQKQFFNQNRKVQEPAEDERKIFCPKCGNVLQIPDSLRNTPILNCPICCFDFSNPLYEHNNELPKNSKEEKKKNTPKKIFFIVATIILFIFIKGNTDLTSNRNSDSHRKGLIRYYLKNEYLKDPESYQAIDWSTTQSGDKTYVTHKYRAKNSFGGYVIEEKTFIFDSDGQLLNIAN